MTCVVDCVCQRLSARLPGLGGLHGLCAGHGNHTKHAPITGFVRDGGPGIWVAFQLVGMSTRSSMPTHQEAGERSALCLPLHACYKCWRALQTTRVKLSKPILKTRHHSGQTIPRATQLYKSTHRVDTIHVQQPKGYWIAEVLRERGSQGGGRHEATV
jgi:hypothetical protein